MTYCTDKSSPIVSCYKNTQKKEDHKLDQNQKPTKKVSRQKQKQKKEMIKSKNMSFRGPTPH